VRRLFSTFAHGAPGAGLLLLRLTLGGILIEHSVRSLAGGAALPSVVVYWGAILLGLLLLLGFWTPVAAALTAMTAIWEAISSSASWPQSVSFGAFAVALALMGPGVWSIDARRYGWKEIKIPGSGREQDPTI
jgi:putative oxidoreductase